VVLRPWCEIQHGRWTPDHERTADQARTKNQAPGTKDYWALTPVARSASTAIIAGGDSDERRL